MTERPRPQPSDYGTADIARHQIVRPELTGHGHAVRSRVKDGCELDRLALKGVINALQHSAGSSFARDLHGARLLGMKTTHFGQTGGGTTQTGTEATALDRVGDAIRQLDHTVGSATRRVTVDVCLSLGQVIGAEAVQTLRAGLDELLLHYDRKPVLVLRTEDLVG